MAGYSGRGRVAIRAVPPGDVAIRMVPAGDPGAVVDELGRVHGVRGLRVADASIMPAVPSANTNVPTIMIGERIGEWLRADLAP